MSNPVSVDFQFSIKQRGRGAKKRIVEGAGQSDESKPALEQIPRISRYMALAIHFEDLIRQGVVTDYADLARLGHVTRARVTQIMNLRLLAPEIQEALLLGETKGDDRTPIQLKSLQFLASKCSWKSQRKLWRNREEHPLVFPVLPQYQVSGDGCAFNSRLFFPYGARATTATTDRCCTLSKQNS